MNKQVTNKKTVDANGRIQVTRDVIKYMGWTDVQEVQVYVDKENDTISYKAVRTHDKAVDKSQELLNVLTSYQFDNAEIVTLVLKLQTLIKQEQRCVLGR